MSDGKNLNPTVHVAGQALRDDFKDVDTLSLPSEIDALEVFEHIRHLNDPEHPLTLEQLKVVQPDHVDVDTRKGTVWVQITPTIPHCSMATLIGLCIRVKLIRSLPTLFKVRVSIFPGSHDSEAAINKQLGDKERVAAALENPHLLSVVDKCIAGTEKIDLSQFSLSALDDI
jgi:metal-sulfur cluster biosynthetic enzyme